MPTRTIFFGTPQFAAPILETLMQLSEIEVVLVVTQPDTPVGRKQILTPPPIKLIAEKYQIPTFQPHTLKSPESLTRIQEAGADLIVLAAYGKIIPATILDLPKFKAVNIHPSALPKYRGATPIQSALMEGEKITASSIMLMEPTLDTGPILAQEEFPISEEDTYFTLDSKLANFSAQLLATTLPKWLSGEIHPQTQNHDQATYTKILVKTDGKLDWQKPAESLHNQIRAFTPWPGSYTTFNGKRIKILETKIGTPNTLTPGKVQTHDKQIFVGCTKNTSVEILRLQEEGKNPMTAKDFILGHPDFDQAMLV